MTDPTSPATATTPPPPPNAPILPGSPPAALTGLPGTALEIAQLLAAGTIDTAQAGKLAKAGSIPTLDIANALSTLRAAAEPKEPDVRTDAQKSVDAQFHAGKPEAFVIRYGEPGQEPTMTPELKQFDASARTWLSTAGMPREFGNSLVSAITRVAQHTKAMTPDQLETYGVNEFQKLQRAHGPRLEERLHAAARMIHALDLKQRGLKNLLKSKGIGDSAMVVNMLIQHAQIYHARQGR